eukprot:jgi/Mesen1/6968/ME000360S06221
MIRLVNQLRYTLFRSSYFVTCCYLKSQTMNWTRGNRHGSPTVVPEGGPKHEINLMGTEKSHGGPEKEKTQQLPPPAVYRSIGKAPTFSVENAQVHDFSVGVNSAANIFHLNGTVNVTLKVGNPNKFSIHYGETNITGYYRGILLNSTQVKVVCDIAISPQTQEVKDKSCKVVKAKIG